MTMISSTILDRISSIQELSRPSVILIQLDKFLKGTLKLKENNNFGLDTGICCFSKSDGIIKYSGAKINLYEKNGKFLNEFKGDKKSIGYDLYNHSLEFKTYEIKINENSNYFFFSDGITDQIAVDKILYGKKRD